MSILRILGFGVFGFLAAFAAAGCSLSREKAGERPAPPPPPPARDAEAVERARQSEALAREAAMAQRDRSSAERAARAEAERLAAERAGRDNPNVARGFEFDQVRIFFATDRRGNDSGEFGPARGVALSYGSMFISVPRRHRTGSIERPSIWRLEFSEDPRKHMVVMRRSLFDRDAFLANVKESLGRSGSDASFVFIHGYNVSFDDAAYRTAQIAYDLDFHGAPVFYSWPSQGALEGYLIDESNVEWSQLNFKLFLLDYAQNSGAGDIYLIAHSMGNRALTRALAALFTEHPEIRGRFKEIILTAPDIDADVFRRELAPKLVAGCDRITLYVSSGDKALLASRKVHGHPRLGDSADGITIVPGIETVDASGLDTSFLEHSYFAESHSVLTDIRRLVLDGMRAAERGLRAVDASAGQRYWSFSADSP